MLLVRWRLLAQLGQYALVLELHEFIASIELPKPRLALFRGLRARSYKRWLTGELRRCYEALIRSALYYGLSPLDLNLMLDSQDKKSFPTRKCSKLTSIRRQLYFVDRLMSLVLGDRRTLEYQEVLKRLRSALEANRLHPSRVESLEQAYFPNLADRYIDRPYELLIYVIPSPLGFNWTNPFTLSLSTVNYLIPFCSHKIGHLAVEIRESGRTRYITGMTGETNLEVIRQILLEKRGMDFLYRRFPGRLEIASHVNRDIASHYLSSKRIACLRLQLDSKSMNLLESYLHRWYQSGSFQNYGLSFEPLKDSGASCVSFALSFLQLAGFNMKALEEDCKRVIKLPKQAKLFGSVGFWSLLKQIFLRRKLNSWSFPGESLDSLEFWDPDLIYNWACTKADSGSSQRWAVVSLERWLDSKTTQ